MVYVFQFQVSTLFDGHLDLLDEFTKFAPREKSALAQNSFQHFTMRSSATPALRKMNVEKVFFFNTFFVHFIFLFFSIDS